MPATFYWQRRNAGARRSRTAHWLLTDKKSPWRRLDWGIAPDQLAS
jgi:hypothetical protein